jgi:hypothetical protein
MSKHLLGGYFPQYPHHDSLPDPEIRTFITNFYHASDRQEANELWISYFTKDAQVLIGRDGGAGQQGKQAHSSCVLSSHFVGLC